MKDNISENRLKVLNKIEQYEKEGRFNENVEDDPPAKELLPNQVDYLNKKLSSKIMTYLVNKKGAKFINKMIDIKQVIIEDVKGIENFTAVKSGAIIACNHFHPFDNFAVWKVLSPYMKGSLYKVINEGNYTRISI